MQLGINTGLRFQPPRQPDAFGRLWVLDAARDYLSPALRASYARAGSIYVPRLLGGVDQVADNVPPRYWDAKAARWVYGWAPTFTQAAPASHDASSWAGGAGIQLPLQVDGGPNGDQDGWALREDSTAGLHYREISYTSTASTPIAVGVVARRRLTGAKRFLSVVIPAGLGLSADAVATFDLTTGEVAKSAGVGGAGMLELGAYRLCWCYATPTSGAAGAVQLHVTDALAASVSARQGDGVSGISVWCANITNTAGPAPITRTSGAAVTVGTPTMSAALSDLGLADVSAGFTFGCTVQLDHQDAPAFRTLVHLDAGTAANRVYLRANNAAGSVGGVVTRAGSSIYTGEVTGLDDTKPIKLAIRVSPASTRLAANGALGADSGALTLPALTTARFGALVNGTFILPGGIADTWLTPNVLTDAQLQAVTA